MLSRVNKSWINQARTFSTTTVGVIGLGKMGTGIARNLAETGKYSLVVHDINMKAANELSKEIGAVAVGTPAEVAKSVDSIVSIVPNDACLKDVVLGETGILAGTAGRASPLLHISCSTVSPFTSRELSTTGNETYTHVSAPVFARPDGIAKKQAFFPLSGGDESDRSRAVEFLSSTSPSTFDFGDDAGAANVVKLSGNFLIASTIQSLAEALALAENNGLDRKAVSQMLTSTIFDCIIYNGYGQRVSERDHQPGGFSLELGLKDVNLVCDTAFKSQVPMPVASLLRDKWLASYAKGRGEIDWSGVALSTSEDSGVNVSKCLEETMTLAAEAAKKIK